MLVVSALNEAVSINITIGTRTESGGYTYSTDQARATRQNVVLTPQNLSALYYAITHNLTHKIEDSMNGSVGVFTTRQRDNLLNISTVYSEETQSNHIQLEIHKGIEESGLPTSSTIFVFPKTSYIENYNPYKPEYVSTVHEGYDAAFYLFICYLEEMIKIGGNGVAGHSNKLVSQALNERIIRIAKNQGIEVSDWFTGNPQSGGGVNSYAANTDNVRAPAIISEGANLSDLLY
jgi:hypothetical protein